MKALSSCKQALKDCIDHKYFAIAHLHKEEKVMKMHIHDCCEIYYAISGGKQFLIDNKFYTISPGDLFVINQYESHYLTQVDKEIHERIVISIHPDYLKQISTTHTDLTYCFSHRPASFNHKLSLTKEQQQRFLFLVNKILSSNGYGADILEKASSLELMLLLNTIYFHNDQKTTYTPPAPKYNAQVEPILAYINANLHESMTIESLTQTFFLSESYICRIFKAATGMTINKYITARRISIAKSLLAQGLSVNQVCEQCGYNDYSNFVKAFSKAVGISPKKYAQLSNS